MSDDTLTEKQVKAVYPELTAKTQMITLGERIYYRDTDDDGKPIFRPYGAPQ